MNKPKQKENLEHFRFIRPGVPANHQLELESLTLRIREKDTYLHGSDQNVVCNVSGG